MKHTETRQNNKHYIDFQNSYFYYNLTSLKTYFTWSSHVMINLSLLSMLCNNTIHDWLLSVLTTQVEVGEYNLNNFYK